MSSLSRLGKAAVEKGGIAYVQVFQTLLNTDRLSGKRKQKGSMPSIYVICEFKKTLHYQGSK